MSSIRVANRYVDLKILILRISLTIASIKRFMTSWYGRVLSKRGHALVTMGSRDNSTPI